MHSKNNGAQRRESRKQELLELVWANKEGEIFNQSDLAPLGWNGRTFEKIKSSHLILLPEGTVLTWLPQRYPLGVSRGKRSIVHGPRSTVQGRQMTEVRSQRTEDGGQKTEDGRQRTEDGSQRTEDGGQKTEDGRQRTEEREETVHSGQGAYAVGAILPPGYLRLLLPAFIKEDNAALLPPFSYTAVVWEDNQFKVAAKLIDDSPLFRAHHFNSSALEKKIKERLNKSPHNRLLKHLSNCALKYYCYTAQNIFYQRWEGGLPTSPTCNADCRGCISTFSQERIKFVPTLKEILEVALPHLQKAPKAIISFGQGCEGEPTFQASLLEKAIKRIRKETLRGVLNLNTNGSLPGVIKRLALAGLGSLRISINSATPRIYNLYYRPQGYSFKKIETSLKVAKDCGLFTSLNLLVFPGITDRREEVEAVINLIERTEIDLLQLRDLNIDPHLYLSLFPESKRESLGIMEFLQILKKRFPHLKIGSFNQYIFGVH